MPDHQRNGPLTIGVLTGWQYYWTATPLSYLDPLIRGMCLAANHLGCRLLLGCGMGSSATTSDPLRPAWPVPSPETDFVPVGTWNTDGLIAITPLHITERSREIHTMIAAGHPVLFVGSGEHGLTLAADNTAGILEAMCHLVDHGHRSIAFIAGSPEDLDGDSGDRLRAYQAAVQIHGLLDDARLVAYGRHVAATGYTAMREILASGALFSAVLASNDESALGAIQALTEAGYRIPQDVAVIGFDDRPESAVQTPALSSVRVPLFRMGYRAVELLIQGINGEALPSEPIRIPTRLIPRESCGCGREPGRAGVPASAVRRAAADVEPGRWDIVPTMTAAVLAGTQGAVEAAVEASCRRLADALAVYGTQAEYGLFDETLNAILQDDTFAQEDAYAWQAAISVLMQTGAPQPALPELLDRARVTISEYMQRQHQRFVVNEHWATNRMHVLTAQLLTALEETRVFEILAQHLPPLGITRAWLALFDDQADPLAWCSVRSLTSPDSPAIRCLGRDFPPVELLPTTEAFSLALLPLVNPRGQLGFVAFDSDNLHLYGAIVQQLAAALHTTQLYLEAMEGRRLAEEADQLKSRFLSTVSHELRTPLNLIVGLSSMLLRASDQSVGFSPETSRDDLERINANAQHLGGLIGDVLDLASSNAGQLRLANEYVDLSEILRMAAETGGRLARDKGLAWRASIPDSGPWVWGDRTRLRQVALNLISNAIKFTRQGLVSLTLETGATSVRVSISDSGLGIPPEEHNAIFSEFRRSDRSVTHGYGGLGLGLSICKRLVELHGGAIGVHSTGHEGDGSTFFFTLPTVSLPAAPVEKLTSPTNGTECILVLTAPGGSGQRLQEHLSQRGFDVQLALVAESADWSAHLVAALPSAIVLDMTSEPAHGWETLKVLKSNPRTRDIPVLFYALAQDNGSVLELDYLTKPIELAKLTQAIDQNWLSGSSDQSTRAVLVVDDDLNTLDMHSRIIQSHWPKVQVLTAKNGREALDILQQVRVDLVLLDLMMPEIDGFGVLEAMRQLEATRAVPVIVLTGQVLSQHDMARLNQGVAAVMSKGMFNAGETLAHLDAALERRRKLGGEAQRLVRAAMAYVHEHYAEPLTRQDLARHVNMAEDYLTSCFHKEVGMAPIAYLNRYRVNQAKLLLKQGDASITDIALAVGFADRGYFSRVFRREVGMSPEAYRRTPG